MLDSRALFRLCLEYERKTAFGGGSWSVRVSGCLLGHANQGLAGFHLAGAHWEGCKSAAAVPSV